MFNPIEINAAARKAAKLLGESGAAGRAEKTVLTFDGNIEGKEYVEALSVVKISDKVFDADSIVSVTFHGVNGFEEYTKEKIAISKGDEISIAVADGGWNSGATLFAVFPEDLTQTDENGVEHTVTKGTYSFYYANDDGLIYYTSRIEYETIHPIDPKYLPGVCLPVVEIADRTALTDAEKARMNEVVNEPYILLTINAAPIVMRRIVEGDYICFIGAIGTQSVGIILMDGAWLISVDTYEGI